MTNMAKFKVKGHQFDFLWIHPKSIFVDPLYQRDLEQGRVQRIANNWNYDLVNEPKVSKRKNGSYYVFDGQHTIAAWIAHEGADAPILCKVYRELTWEEEKELFILQNGIQKDPTTTDKLRAEYNDEHSKTGIREMIAICASCGVKVNFEQKGKKDACHAVAALYGAYATLQSERFALMISTLAKAWNGQEGSYSAGMIKGMKYMYQHYDFKQNEMIKSISRYSPDWYLREAKNIAGSSETKYSTLFLRVYNNKRTTGRLSA